jgi:hypothetical protein
MRVVALLSILAGVFMGSNAFAGMGAAGCGLGSVIMKKNSIMSQTFAMSTNGSFSSQFWGITTGTSNCNAKGFASVDQDPVIYAESNMDSIQIDLARGEGEHLEGLVRLMGCSDAEAGAAGQALRGQYDQISSTESAAEMVEAISQGLSCSRAV